METTLENTTPKSGWLHRLVSRLSVTWLTLRVGRAIGRASAHYATVDQEVWKKAMDSEMEEAWAREEKLEAEIKHLKGELAYMKLQRDALLEITWLDLPDEPNESTAKWRAEFNKGWIRREALSLPCTCQPEKQNFDLWMTEMFTESRRGAKNACACAKRRNITRKREWIGYRNGVLVAIAALRRICYATKTCQPEKGGAK